MESALGREPLFLGVGVASAAMFSARMLDALLALNLLLLVVASSLHLFAALSERLAGSRLPPRRRWAREPFVSIHVPIHDEPSHIVARTLEALRRLEWSAYEVVVLDNNTRDERVWRPVERLCARLGPRFRFHHVERLQGAKAAALNLCLRIADPRTELILVVDADYRVHPRLLARAARYFEQPGTSHVQFPQAYRKSETAAGLVGDFATYFDVFAPFASRRGAALLTGTLCLVQKQALLAAGGWSAHTLTEDAELGVRLVERGFRGCYAPEVAGRGVVPGDLAALRKQRRRWVYGNAQTLFALGLGGLRALGLRRALATVTQLSAWFHFLLLPALVLPLLALTPGGLAEHRVAATLAAAAFPLTLAFKALLFIAAPNVLEERKRRARALLAHLGTLWEGSVAWLSVLVGVRLAFERTSKVPRRGSLRAAAGPLVVAAALAASTGALLAQGHGVLATFCFLGSLMFGAVLYVDQELAQHAAFVEGGAQREVRDGHGFAAHQRHDPDVQPRWHLPGEGDRGGALPDVSAAHRHRRG